jgi:hypothetical protein
MNNRGCVPHNHALYKRLDYELSGRWLAPSLRSRLGSREKG